MTDHKHDASDPYAKFAQKTDRSVPPAALIGGAVVVVLLLGLVAFLVAGGDKSSGGAAKDKAGTGANAAANAVREQSGVVVEGEALPAYPSEGVVLAPPEQDPAVGLLAPTLKGKTFDGSDLTIDPGDGEAKVVLFFAHWCPHCQREIPKIQKWIDDGELPDDVKIYGVSTAVSAQQPNYPPSKWLLNEGWTPPVLLDDDEKNAAAAYALPGYPYFVALNADGTVAQRGSGEVPIDQFASMVDSLER